ncbi:MAG: hypothetical protein ABI746_12640, partial [Dermatophilaceae bacterium]
MSDQWSPGFSAAEADRTGPPADVEEVTSGEVSAEGAAETDPGQDASVDEPVADEERGVVDEIDAVGSLEDAVAHEIDEIDAVDETDAVDVVVTTPTGESVGDMADEDAVSDAADEGDDADVLREGDDADVLREGDEADVLREGDEADVSQEGEA